MQIIYLNGPSSVGKTTLAKALQETLDEPFLHLSFDKAIGWMPQKMNDWEGGHSPLGFSWKHSQDTDGFPMQLLKAGPFAHKIQHSFRNVVLYLAQSGYHLIVDDFAFGQENRALWQEMLKDFSVLWVGLKAPLEVLEQREKERKERIAGSARAQFLQFQQENWYDVELDTHNESIRSLIQKIQERLKSPIRTEIERIIRSVIPVDFEEKEHIDFILRWLASGAEIFRIAKPATPDPHLVAYFLIIDPFANKVLLVDHKKAELWLPAGGHVELHEHPKETVKREIIEELGIQAEFLHHDPLFVTVAKTVGQTAGHTDVSLWYILKGNSSDTLKFDKEEFHQIQWYDPVNVPYLRTDPHMSRCINKLKLLKFLSEA